MFESTDGSGKCSECGVKSFRYKNYKSFAGHFIRSHAKIAAEVMKPEHPGFKVYWDYYITD